MPENDKAIIESNIYNATGKTMDKASKSQFREATKKAFKDGKIEAIPYNDGVFDKIAYPDE
ncbi:hypothetical protein KBA84_03935 [Patescibacteria group bacterium]|nr:hypothetical protein [Patescibacteria group bacterium]